MIKRISAFAAGISIFLCLAGSLALGADTIHVTKQALDHATLHVDQISKEQPFHVRLFDSTNADLGKPKHRDTAELLARSAPYLLAVDIVEALRDAGFREVVLDEQAPASSAHYVVLTGQFTQLNPGSQAARAWIGFGAGESKVCVEGRIDDDTGKTVGEFSHCRKGLGWGTSGGQMESSAARIGDAIAIFITEWADGKYAR